MFSNSTHIKNTTNGDRWSLPGVFLRKEWPGNPAGLNDSTRLSSLSSMNVFGTWLDSTGKHECTDLGACDKVAPD